MVEKSLGGACVVDGARRIGMPPCGTAASRWQLRSWRDANGSEPPDHSA